MDRESRASRVIRALRRVNVEGSVFGQTVALRFGLSESDVEALERLADIGTTTAGRLAEAMGLTTGAVTRVLDRLEQAGYVRRTSDPADRRRVIVSLVSDKADDIEALTDRLAKASEAALSRYTEDQLDAIADFLVRMSDVTRTETATLRDVPAAEEARSGEHAAPLGGIASARLVARGGVSELGVRANQASGSDLYRARFGGSIPQVRTRGGIVSVHYRGGRPWDWRKRTADFALNPTIPWDLSVTGGSGRLRVDGSLLDLRGVEVTGGVDRLAISLGSPRGEVPIRVTGGSSEVRVERPPEVPLRLMVRGGVGQIELDGRRVGGAGPVDLTTAGFDRAADRVVVDVTGGSGRVAVGVRAPGGA